MARKLIIAGAPASGKGTQAELIVDTYGCIHLSTGDILRAAAADPGNEVGAKAATFMNAGLLVPDELIITMVLDRLAMKDCVEKGWLLDGFPRTRAQAQSLTEAGFIPDQLIFLDVPQEILVERVTGRRTDPETGRIYHLTFSPPETEEINARLTQRADDRVENVKPRVQTFQQNLSGVMEMYKSCILRVDGTQDKATIFDRIKERLDSLRKYSVIFVLGGPGRYKEENCEHIAKVYGYKHLNTGDLLRQEHEAGGDMAEIIGKSHETGAPIPGDLVVGLLKKAMETSPTRLFLIDAFPRPDLNLDTWFSIMGEEDVEIQCVLNLCVDDEVVIERIVSRAKAEEQADGNLQLIKKKLESFHESSTPIIKAFSRAGLLRTVRADAPIPIVYKRVDRILRGMGLIPQQERTLAMIKPDAVSAGSPPAIIEIIERAGLVVIEQRQELLSRQKAEAFYSEHKDRPFFGTLVDFMTSSPVIALTLEGVGAVKRWRALMGPTNTEKAKAEAPDSLHALFGTDGTKNAVHGSDSLRSALREVEFWFPNGFTPQTTLAMIKPATQELHREEILDCMTSRGFEVIQSCTQQMDRATALEFYAEHQGKPFLEANLVPYMTSGSSEVLLLKRDGAIKAWRALMGPTNTEKAKKEAPFSIRGMFGMDNTRNAVHGSDSPSSAARERLFWFPAAHKDTSCASAQTTGTASGADDEQEQVLNYLRTVVDPVMAPLLQQIINCRPEDVGKFVIQNLQTLRRGNPSHQAG